MINVDRGTVEEPEVLRSSRAERARELARTFFTQPDTARPSKGHRFDQGIYEEAGVRSALQRLFDGKCAFCESPRSASSPVETDHFRPKYGAVGRDGARAPDHYWWLAYEWSNLYSICRPCSAQKGPRFSVAAERARPPAIGEQLLEEEESLILDPCLRPDRPGDHLIFTDDGRVVPQTTKGEVTIECFALNRPALVAARREAVREAWSHLLGTIAASHDPVVHDEATTEAIDDLLANHWPYAAARRQHLRRELEKLAAGPPGTPLTEGAANLLLDSRIAGIAYVSEAKAEQTIEGFAAGEQKRESFSLTGRASRQSRERYYARFRRIERIEIENFKVIADLDFEFPDPQSSQMPWLMLLGENGVGKSSVMQAVALALVGDEYRRRLDLDAARFVRAGRSRGEVRVMLAGRKEPVRLTFDRESPEFDGNATEPQVLLLGYGATRLLPRSGHRRALTPRSVTDYVRVDNLLDPFLPLNDAVAWLRRLKRREFEVVQESLKGLLQLNEGDRLVKLRAREDIALESYRLRVPLGDLSDGTQAVTALATDIMEVMFRRWAPSQDDEGNVVVDAEGLVLIDEIDAHLHPRWRMQIVSSLRRLFPRIQFIASTHDPLALRGLNDGEVVVMRRSRAGGIVALTDLPSVRGLTVEQLLTSEHFGLSSTVDPELEQIFEEYYELRARSSRTVGEEERLRDLEGQLEQYEVLGQTPRERLMLEAIDQHLAQTRQLTDAETRNDLHEETVRQLVTIWDDVRAEIGEAE